MSDDLRKIDSEERKSLVRDIARAMAPAKDFWVDLPDKGGVVHTLDDLRVLYHFGAKEDVISVVYSDSEERGFAYHLFDHYRSLFENEECHVRIKRGHISGELIDETDSLG